MLRPAVQAADLVVLAALIPGEVAPMLVDEAAVAGMRPGSVIVDIAIDQGGNCALTSPGETVVRQGVTIIGIKTFRAAWRGLQHGCSAGISAVSFSTWLWTTKLPCIENDEIVASSLVTRRQILHKARFRQWASLILIKIRSRSHDKSGVAGIVLYFNPGWLQALRTCPAFCIPR